MRGREAVNYDDEILYVHLIPHSHDDVGWKKTVDQYFSGSNDTIQRAEVQYVIDEVVQTLLAEKDKKFSYVEVAYFKRWWRVQTPEY